MRIRHRVFYVLIAFGVYFCSIVSPALAQAATTPPTASLPAQMRFCGLRCFILTFVNGKYNAVPENAQTATVTSTYEIKRFDRQSVVIRRHDVVSGANATLGGQVSSAGDFVANATITWDTGGQIGQYELSWGEALARAKPPTQDDGNGAKAVSSSALAALPPSILDCEGGICNGYWSFTGVHGKSIWPAEKTVGTLTIKGLGSGKIGILGTVQNDERGPAVYTGVISGDGMSGTVARGNQMLPWRTVALRTPRFNLNGIWRPESPDANALRIDQHGEHVEFTIVSPKTNNLDGAVPASAPKFTPVLLASGVYRGGEIVGEYRNTPFSKAGPIFWYVNDADSLAYYVGGDQSSPIMRYRASPPDPDSPTCDDDNSTDTSGRYAYVRGQEALHMHRYTLALCWFRSGGLKNDGKSDVALAEMFLKGYPGVPKDFAKALTWATMSHREDNYEGEFLVSYIYRKGLGVPVNISLAQGWYNLAQADTLINPYELSGPALTAYENSKIMDGVSRLIRLMTTVTAEDCTDAERFDHDLKRCVPKE